MKKAFLPLAIAAMAILGITALIIVVREEAVDRDVLLNVSYDPTREFYNEYDKQFAEQWKAKTGRELKVRQSHGGSGRQARAVISGLKADVVTLALAYDIDAIAERSERLPKDWQKRLPNNSSPYTSTIVFLVRKGNPKGIHDWGDLVKPGIEVITPNPKTSGGARWNVLAAWAWAHEHFNGDEAKMRAYLGDLFKRVPVLDTGARASTTTFVQREIGDVLLSWENEAFLAKEKLGADKFDIVVPSVSVLAEPPVTVVDVNADAHGTRQLSQEYLEGLYTKEAQQLIAKHHYRPALPEHVSKEVLEQFPKLRLVSIDDPMFGGWHKAQKTFFADDGIFDQVYGK